MAEVKMRKELLFETPDEPGVLAKVCDACGNAGVNIEAICAYGQEGKGHFLMCTSDNGKAMEALKGMGYETTENDVVMVSMENAPGKMAEMTKKVSDAGVNLRYIYGSTGMEGQPSFVILNSEDNAKVLEVLQ